jgi:hypothetical protein
MQKKDSRICKGIAKNPSKKIITALVAALLCASLFARGGMLSGEKKLRVVKTKWFDIIYPQRCEASAAILVEKADGVYDEVTAQYGLTPAFRMPVVITPAVDQFNAFWTSVPYNHIAIYDTGASGASELAVFSETLLSTFRHELTHAVTFNMKNGFWRGLDVVFGDCLAPGMLSVTTGMAEGATVTSESAAGEGRLNDEYAKHYVKQAKIEGKFPSYHDVSGSSDVMPGGAPYYFNGAFHGWLQDKYGMESYAEFWYRVVNGKNFTISGAFKKAFGLKLKEAWKLFAADYEVPSLQANPVQAGLVQDFFEPDENDYSEKNNAGSVYESLSAAVSAAGNKLIWMDRYGGRVFLREGDSAEQGDRDSDHDSDHDSDRQLFSLRGLTEVSLSSDGRFVAAGFMSDNSPTLQARVKLYDIENRSFYLVKEHGLKGAAILENEGEYFLIAQKYLNQQYSIVIYKILLSTDGRRIKGTELFSQNQLGPETNPYAFTPLQDGAFAWLKKEGMNYSLCISRLDGSLLQELAFSDGMAVRSLSAAASATASQGRFYFSYAQKGTMPRLGIYDSESGQLLLSSQDISGGVFEPLFWNDQLVYIGEFYRQNRILTMALPSADIMEPADFVERDAIAERQSIPAPQLQSKTYNPFAYLYRGILIPVGDYTPDFIGPDASETSDFLDYRLGATFITSDPWTSGSTDLYMLTAAYDLKAKATGAALTINKGTDTSLFQTQTQIKSEFNSKGWKQGGANFTASSSLGFGNNSKITLSNSASAILGKKEELYYSIEDIVTLSYSNARKAGPGRFEKTGLAFSVSYGGRKDESITGPYEKYVDISALSAAAKLYIPHLLPFESKYGFTYNLPLTLGAKVLPNSSIYGYANLGQESVEKNRKYAKNQLGRVVFDANAEILAFSMDIQKAIPGVTALYLNDFYVAAGYAGTGTAGTANYGGFQTAKLGEYFKAVGDGRGYYLDSAYLKASLEFTPNIGIFASSNYKMSLYGIYSYTIHSAVKLKPEERLLLTLGLDTSF